jgi:hypothetical protein
MADVEGLLLVQRALARQVLSIALSGAVRQPFLFRLSPSGRNEIDG